MAQIPNPDRLLTAEYIPPDAHLDPDSDHYNPRELARTIPKTTDYTHAAANRILDRLEEGRTLEQVQTQCNGFEPRVVLNWAKQCTLFNNALVDSLEIRAEVLMDQIVSIADGVGNAAKIKHQIETRKELAAFDNKRFVKRTRNELTGPDGGALALNAQITMRTPMENLDKETFEKWRDDFFAEPIGDENRPPAMYIPSSLFAMEVEDIAAELRALPRDKLQAALDLYNKLPKHMQHEQAPSSNEGVEQQ